MRTIRHHLILTSATLLCLFASGCATIWPRHKDKENAEGAPPASAQNLPIAPAQSPVQVVDGARTPLDDLTALLTAQSPNSSVARDGRYQLLAPTPSDDSNQFAASRVYQPGTYRVLYYPDETHSDYEAEGTREIVSVTTEQMRPGAFTPLSRGGGVVDTSNDNAVTPKTAREYVAPDRQLADAASRLSNPLRSGANVEETAGLGMTAEYRRAKVRFNGSSEEVSGFVRPLGVLGTDDESVGAARDALDRRAGEQLVFFPEFGWGGFVADSRRTPPPVEMR